MPEINSSTIIRKVFQKLELSILGKVDFTSVSTCLSSVREHPDNLNLGDLQHMVRFIYCVLSKYSKYSVCLTQAQEHWTRI